MEEIAARKERALKDAAVDVLNAGVLGYNVRSSMSKMFEMEAERLKHEAEWMEEVMIKKDKEDRRKVHLYQTSSPESPPPSKSTVSETDIVTESLTLTGNLPVSSPNGSSNSVDVTNESESTSSGYEGYVRLEMSMEAENEAKKLTLTLTLTLIGGRERGEEARRHLDWRFINQ